MFKTARNLLAPQKIHSVPWETLMTKLRCHYAPIPSRIALRHAFYHRNQKEGETINQFIAALRAAALYCKFRNLDDALLDRLVCGIRALQLQCHLLAKIEITLQTALDEARTAELSNKSTTEIQQANSPTTAFKPDLIHHEDLDTEDGMEEDDEIHRLESPPEKSYTSDKTATQTVCLGCGGNHLWSACKFRNISCLRCGQSLSGYSTHKCFLSKDTLHKETYIQTNKKGRRLFHYKKR